MSLSEILVSQVGGKRERSLALSGPRVLVQNYLRLLRAMERRGALAIQQRFVLAEGHRCKLTDEQIADVAAQLPPEPWPKGIHRIVASKLGLTNKQVSEALGILAVRPRGANAAPATDTPIARPKRLIPRTAE